MNYTKYYRESNPVEEKKTDFSGKRGLVFGACMIAYALIALVA